MKTFQQSNIKDSCDSNVIDMQAFIARRPEGVLSKTREEPKAVTKATKRNSHAQSDDEALSFYLKEIGSQIEW